MRLARDLGMTRNELWQRMSQSEFMDWIAYYRYDQAEREMAQEEAQQRAKRRR